MSQMPKGLVISSGPPRMGKAESPKPKPSAQWLNDVRRLQAMTAARKASGQMAMSQEEIDLAGKVWGRTITVREQMSGEIERRDDRSFEAAVRQDYYKAVMPAPKVVNEYDALIADAMKAVEAERLQASMQNATEAERRLLVLQLGAKQAAEQQAREQQETESLKAREKQIKAMEALQQRANMDPNFSYEDLVEISNTLTQLRTPLSDDGVCNAMTQSCLDREKQIIGDIIQAAQKSIAQQQAELAELAKSMGVSEPQKPTRYEDDPEWQKLSEEIEPLNARDPEQHKLLRQKLDQIKAIEAKYPAETISE